MYYTTRSEAKSQQVLEDLVALSPEIKRENIKWLALDYADLTTVAAAAEKLQKEESGVDILGKSRRRSIRTVSVHVEC